VKVRLALLGVGCILQVTFACLNTFIALLPQDLIVFRQVHAVHIVIEMNDTGTC